MPSDFQEAVEAKKVSLETMAKLTKTHPEVALKLALPHLSI